MRISKIYLNIFCLYAKNIDLIVDIDHNHVMTEQRYLTKYVLEDLTDKMVFIGGPRQVGKTTLARELVSGHFQHSGYYNWDNRQDRRCIEF